MPAKDGTGPMGQGPMTGRGLGPCGDGYTRGRGRGYWCRFGGQRTFTREEEPSAIKADIEWLRGELKAAEERLKQTEKK